MGDEKPLEALSEEAEALAVLSQQALGPAWVLCGSHGSRTQRKLEPDGLIGPQENEEFSVLSLAFSLDIRTVTWFVHHSGVFKN